LAAILVIDDDEAFRNVLRRMLLRAGHQVVEAADRAAALESLKRALVDLVITDITMPNMEGIDAPLHDIVAHAFSLRRRKRFTLRLATRYASVST